MKWYVKGKKSLANKETDYDTNTMKIALFTTTLVPDQNADQYFDAAPYTSNQLSSASGYTTGGGTLATKTATATTLKFVLSSAGFTWNFTALRDFRYAIIYDDTPASNKPLYGFVDLNAQSINAVDFTINPDAVNGWLYDTIS